MIAPIHHLDLPRLKGRMLPSFETLATTLEQLTIAPPDWSNPTASSGSAEHDPGITHWLTMLVSSDLHWLDTDDERDAVLAEASKRLAERCGRSAAPAMTRTFSLPTPSRMPTPIGTPVEMPFTELRIHEPPLTSDNLGLKTWGTSFLLAKRLPLLFPPPTTTNTSASESPRKIRALELGAGTGLVGLAAASTLGWSVHLTDLPEIIPNLQKNIDLNEETIHAANGRATSGILDWNTPDLTHPSLRDLDIVLASDCLYASSHPTLVAHVTSLTLPRNAEAKFVVSVPVRPGGLGELPGMLWSALERVDLVILEEGEDLGWDDWGSGEIRCRWGVWGWKEVHAKD
ncbi:Protein-lysine N-methyltransferase rrg1 [Saitoella coloradoensis]